MPFDAVFLTAVTGELTRALLGARVDKIYQPERNTVLLTLRGPGGAHRLLITVNPNRARVQLTKLSFENPAQPPMFCMLLRKHLLGGRLTEIAQPPAERAVRFTFDCTDEMGVPVQKHLHAELMGRTSNLILCDADGRIIDCLRRVDLTMSEQRQVLPGLFYHLPPTQEKLNPLAVEPEQLARLLARSAGCLDKWLVDTFAGLSPLVAREFSFRLTGLVDCPLPPDDPQRLAQQLYAFFDQIRTQRFEPVMLVRPDGKGADFSWLACRQYGAERRCEPFGSFSDLLDEYYGAQDFRQRMQQKSQTLRKSAANLYDRVTRKLAVQRKELAATYDRERTRQLGDIVMANLYQIKRGQTRLTAVDFYDPEMKQIDVPLSPKLSPQQNAAKFYKDYTKAKNAEKFLTEQIAKGEAEQDYLASVLDTITRAENERDLDEIRLELEAGGYLRRSGRQNRPKTAPARPMEFRSSDGYTIYVGRNNRQNDLLTLKLAQRSDLWLHTQKIHGSHVIVCCDTPQPPPDRTVTEAMILAAYYSQAREGQGVPVDYTPVRYVKKPNGAKPGMVIYTTYRTGYVTPDAATVDRLRVK